jgi:DNA-binding protein HU-beta
MNTSELVKSVASSTAMTQETIKMVLDATIATIVATLTKGEEVRLQGLGNFSVKDTAARQGRNPATGESIQIAAGKKLSFKPSSELKKNL